METILEKYKAFNLIANNSLFNIFYTITIRSRVEMETILEKYKALLEYGNVSLKVLSSEMDPAEIRLIR